MHLPGSTTKGLENLREKGSTGCLGYGVDEAAGRSDCNGNVKLNGINGPMLNGLNGPKNDRKKRHRRVVHVIAKRFVRFLSFILFLVDPLNLVYSIAVCPLVTLYTAV